MFKKAVLENELDPIIHAHTLYSDGITAWLFARQAPSSAFVITVRGTDINQWFKLMRPLKFIVKKVIQRSTKIVFVCPQHKEAFISYFGDKWNSRLEIIPNGINNDFIDQSLTSKPLKKNGDTVALYVGKANRNKNLLNALAGFRAAIESNATQNSTWKFIFAGLTKTELESVYGPVDPNILKNLEFIDFVESPLDLIGIYDRADIFIMPSLSETFGLVYVEAISRCVPVVYLKGQGIDGYFEDSTIGFATADKSPQEIARAVKQCFKLFPEGLTFKSNPSTEFSWDNVAKQYSATYIINNQRSQ